MKPQNSFAKYELPLFLLLTYTLSWWSAPLMNGQIIPHGPAFAALIVLALSGGRQGLGAWWRRLTHWRVPAIWYLAGPVVILSYHIVGLVTTLLLGAEFVSPPGMSLGIFLELLFLGGLWEEPGWSGYLLPKMKQRFENHPNALLIAALITGIFRSLWHLPLFIYGHIPWFDIFIFSFAFQIIIAWIFYRSGGSVPVTMLFHFVSNLMGAFTVRMFTGTDHTLYTAMFMFAATLFALALIWRSQFKSKYTVTRERPAT